MVFESAGGGGCGLDCAGGASFAGALGGNGTYVGNCPPEYQGCLANSTGGFIGITGSSLYNCSASNSCKELSGSSNFIYEYTPGGQVCVTIGAITTCGDPIPPKLEITTGPQIGMNIFQFGVFTQADRLVKAGTAYTAVGITAVVAAPTVVAGAPYVVSGYEATDTFLIQWAAGDFEGYTATMEMVRGLISADIVPESPTDASAFGSWVGCFLWGDDPCPGIRKIK